MIIQGVCFPGSGRLLPGEAEYWAGPAAAVHLGGALQGQGVQHPCALQPSDAALRTGPGEERTAGTND